MEDIEEDTEMRDALKDEVSELKTKKTGKKRVDSEDFVVSDAHEETPVKSTALKRR